MTYLLFLTAGVGVIWLGIKTKEEVLRLAAAIAGAVLLVWGFARTPVPLQLAVEILIVVAVFSICLRCWEK